MKIIESYDATPNTNLLDVLANSGYSLQSAIADIVDNSLTAQSSNIWINMEYDEVNPFITIIDDGYGMTLEELKHASIIAFQNMMEERKANDLGRFSTGIISASASMCNQLLIQSKTKKDKNVSTVLIDFTKMKDNGWINDVVEIDEKYVTTNSGTAIIWNNLKPAAKATNRNTFYEKVDVVEKHISHVFNDYISDGIVFHINNNYIVKGWDPFFTKNIKTTMIFDEEQKYHESKIRCRLYILPPYNNLSDNDKAYMRGYGLSEQQGFYIFRNNRLIKEGDWLGIDGLSISNKYDYARIRVDIDNKLDKYFNPNFLKNEIFIPDDLIDYFKKIANKARKESHKSFNYMKAPSIIKTVKKENQIPVWNCKGSKDGILISVNENHPIIKSIVSNMNKKDKNRLFRLLSKNIPVGEIYRSGVSKKQTVYPDIEKEMEDMYSKLLEDGLSNKEIMKKMSSCEPFCLSDEYISVLIEFFEKEGVLDLND